MSSRKNAARVAMACLLTAGSLTTTGVVLADTDTPAPEAGTTEAGTTEAGTTEAGTTEAGTTEAGMTEAGMNALGRASAKTSEAMFEIRAARVAIFNGLLEESRELTTLAAGNLDAARLALQVYRRVEGRGDAADLRRDWVPFNTSIVEYIDIDSDRQALRALDEASAYLAQGKALDAAESLSEVGGGASVTTAYLPVGSSLELLEEAATLLDDERYHEANMALKSVENSARQSNVTVTR